MSNSVEKDALWESYHEHVGSALFSLGTEIAQFIVDDYNSRARLRSQSSYASLVKKGIYNEWAIIEGLLEMTFQWADDHKSKNDDIVIVLKNLLGTPQLQIKEGWCPKVLQDALLNSDLVQRFIGLDEEYGDFLAAATH